VPESTRSVPRVDLFAVQPFVDASTYASVAAFRTAMARLMDRCVARRHPDVPAVAVFPEHVGTFLALAPLGRLGARAGSTGVATALALAVRPVGVARAVARRGLEGLRNGGVSATALLALGEETRAAYEDVFAGLARASGCTVVAGSALLPDGDDGAVYNLSLTFAPDGRACARTRKVNLVPEIEDRMGLARGDASTLGIAETDAGRVGTLICYDGFAVPHTATEPTWCAVGTELARRGAQVVAQPAANPWTWEGRWVHAPAGSRLLRRTQWQCEGLAAQLAAMEGVRYGVTAHLVGAVLDQRFEGRSEILRRDDAGGVSVVADAPRADLSPGSACVVHARVDAGWDA
jgi:predicted amidohydrolase